MSGGITVPDDAIRANDVQVGGGHYKDTPYQHWDLVADNDLDYFAGPIIKYTMRWKKKNGIQDLYKAKHFMDKYIELIKEGRIIDPITPKISVEQVPVQEIPA
jgi:hypothetical protein